MDRIDAMQAFVAVADLRGFAPAARKLGLSPSGVTRLIAALEDRLGARLLQRTTRSVTLTDVGTRYLERISSHDVALRSLARIRTRFYERIEPLAPAQLEGYRRGPYAGAVLYSLPDGTMDACIALRTIVVRDGVAHLATGAA